MSMQPGAPPMDPNMQPPPQNPSMQTPPVGAPPIVQPPQIPPELMPNVYDNHEAHIHYHNQYRKSQEFELLPEHVKQIFEQHVNLHQQALMLGAQPAAGGPILGGQQQQMDPSQQMSQQQASAISGAPQQ